MLQPGHMGYRMYRLDREQPPADRVVNRFQHPHIKIEVPQVMIRLGSQK
jgi:hypothetical protein